MKRLANNDFIDTFNEMCKQIIDKINFYNISECLYETDGEIDIQEDVIRQTLYFNIQDLTYLFDIKNISDGFDEFLYSIEKEFTNEKYVASIFTSIKNRTLYIDLILDKR